MEHTKHIWRAAFLVVGFLLALIVGRHFVVPDTFGDLGYYRAAAVDEFMEIQPVHGGKTACAECHEKQQKTHDEGKHKGVLCEVCHEPVAVHVKDGKKSAVMPTNPSRQLCQGCHLKLVARPKTFPQIVPDEHLVQQGALEAGEPVPEKACSLCHPAHKPDVEREKK